MTILNLYINDSRFRFYVGSILCSYIVSKSIRDHFEPIYPHRFYVGSILCAYIVSESMLGRFCVHIYCQNQFLTILNLYINDSRVRFYVGSILCSSMVSKSMLDHFEPIYPHRFYVGSILCAYIVSKSMLGRFCVIYRVKIIF